MVNYSYKDYLKQAAGADPYNYAHFLKKGDSGFHIPKKEDDDIPKEERKRINRKKFNGGYERKM